MTIDELRHNLGSLGLETTGSKELKERLHGASTTDDSSGKRLKNTDKAVTDEPERRRRRSKTHAEDERHDNEDDGREEAGPKTSGNKAAPRSRLRTALEKDDSKTDEETDDSESEEDDETANRNVITRRRSEFRHTSNFSGDTTQYCRQTTLTFKDVEDALETFSGDSGENVR